MKKEIFNLDVTIAEFVSPLLKQFKGHANGIPGEIYAACEEDEELAGKVWDEILDKMIFSFDSIIDSTSYDDGRIQEGLNMFAKYYKHLWI